MKADGAAFIRMEETLDFLSFRSGHIRCTNVEASYCSESAPPPGIRGQAAVSTAEASVGPTWTFWVIRRF